MEKTTASLTPYGEERSLTGYLPELSLVHKDAGINFLASCCGSMG